MKLHEICNYDKNNFSTKKSSQKFKAIIRTILSKLLQNLEQKWK